MLIIYAVNVSNFPARVELESGEVSFQQNLLGLSSHG
jgi:hypothetical protein